MGEGPYLRSAQEEGLDFSQQMLLVLCCVEEETINHILVHCSKVKILWDLVFSLFGVNWVLPFTMRDTLLSWYVSFKDKKHRKVWRAVPLCLFWTVLKEKNRIVFDNEALSTQRLKNPFLSWAKSSIVFFFIGKHTTKIY